MQTYSGFPLSRAFAGMTVFLDSASRLKHAGATFARMTSRKRKFSDQMTQRSPKAFGARCSCFHYCNENEKKRLCCVTPAKLAPACFKQGAGARCLMIIVQTPLDSRLCGKDGDYVED